MCTGITKWQVLSFFYPDVSPGASGDPLGSPEGPGGQRLLLLGFGSPSVSYKAPSGHLITTQASLS